MSIRLFFFSKHSFFIRTYYNFGHTHIRCRCAKTERDKCCDRREFESPTCIIDFLFLSRSIINEAVKFYNNDHLSYFCVFKKRKKRNEK